MNDSPDAAGQPGTYALILRSRRRTTLTIGRRGSLEIAPGYYVYVGSAFGPGGVAARVRRHFRRAKKKHWHIDYLREVLAPIVAWCSYDAERLEHRWAAVFQDLPGMTPVPGFGCTDCRCEAHLFHCRRMPDARAFGRRCGSHLDSLAFPADD